MIENTSKLHLQKLDVIRGIAIILVFSIHSILVCTEGNHEIRKFENGIMQFDGASLKLILLTFFPLGYGWTGVQLFLLISGFLIHFSFLQSGAKSLNLTSFFNRRFWRIYPPYFICLLFFAFVNSGLHISFSEFKNLLSHIFLLHNLSDTTFFTYNAAFWSLALEFQLYLLYPLFLFFKNKFGIKNTMYIVAAIYIACMLARFLLGLHQTWMVNFVFKNWIIWCLGAYWSDNFFHGKRTFNGSIWWVILLGVLFYGSRAIPVVGYFADILAVLFYLCLGDIYLNYKPLKTNILEKILIEIGIVSYSIYLIHQPFMHQMFDAIHIFGISYQSSIFRFLDAIFVFLIIFFVSYGIYHFIEKPAIEFGKKFYKKYLEK
jgi:peptidoglycan/LPS O-acetylase OafA/YrhL